MQFIPLMNPLEVMPEKPKNENTFLIKIHNNTLFELRMQVIALTN